MLRQCKSAVPRTCEVLPVFASVPIEWCLVNIPGIAPYFMNVNDDMFIGKDVESPSTFFHDKMAGDHRVFLESWPFKRSCYCSINLIGNGKCNAQCNNEACGYDHGDCENSEDRAEVLAKHREALLFKATHPGKLDKDAGEFLDSLQYSSSILNREFGHPKFLYGNRRQGQHVPYFTSTKIFKDRISHFAPEVELTLSHRFRHPFDLQYALCYYYYVDATRLYAPSYKQLWHTAFNTADSSEFLFDSRGSQKQFEWEAVQRVRYEKIKQSREYQVLKECVNDPSILAGLVDAPAINVTLIRSCDDAATALLNDYEIRLPIKEIGDGNGVASVQFLMLDDNVGNNIQKLKKLKENIGTFNTLNDDMTIVSDKMEAAYHEFFTDLFPNPSGFEKI